jgi:two-component system response regulator MprA
MYNIGMIMKILVVEDEKDLRDYLKELLLDNNYAVELADDGASALNYVKKTRPDLVILDLGLPDIDGKTVCTDVKKMYPDLPVLILTARNSTADIVTGLNLGADDYVSKPFVSEELIARIKVKLRHSDSDKNVLEVGDLKMDTRTMRVERAGKLVSLTKTEFDLLRYLMANEGKVLTRENILNRIWLYSPDIESRVVDVYIGYLRRKIDNGYPKKLIQSIRGFGYTIKEE